MRRGTNTRSAGGLIGSSLRPAERARRQGRKGVTLVEVLVVLACITALLGIVLPAMAHAREKGRATVCRSKSPAPPRPFSSTRRITTATSLVTTGTGCWWARIRVTPPFTCPDLPGARHTVRANPDEGESVPGYAANAALFNNGPGIIAPGPLEDAGRHEAAFPFPTTTVAFCETREGILQDLLSGHPPAAMDTGRSRRRTGDHGGAQRIRFLDGHVQWFRPEQVVGCCWKQLARILTLRPGDVRPSPPSRPPPPPPPAAATRRARRSDDHARCMAAGRGCGASATKQPRARAEEGQHDAVGDLRAVHRGEG